MKEIKRKLALVLTVCMVLNTVIPAYADEIAAPEETAVQQEASDIAVSEINDDAEPEETVPDEISYEDKTILENIEKATPANADYVEPEETLDDPEMDALEEATPANAEYIEEFIREIVVDGITITLTADPGVFPEEAELWAEKVEDEATEEAIEEAVEKERENDVNVAASYKFDIKMFVNGEEVQPDTSKGSVKVTFTLAEELSECLDANAYHLKEDADGEFTAENLGAEVKSVDEAAEEETDKKAGDNSETVKTVIVDEDEVLSDGTIEDDVTTKVTMLEAETDSFSYYVVEFTYSELQYVLAGDSTIKLSEILKALAIEGTVSEAEVSNKELFTVIKDAEGDDWTVTALQAFSSEEWLKVTIGEQVYEITVTDTNNGIKTETVEYIDEKGYPQTKTCIIIEDITGQRLTNGWYVVGGDFSLGSFLVIEGDVHLILKDGCTFSQNEKIEFDENLSLTVYGQAEGTGCWKYNNRLYNVLKASNGSLTINGGNIETLNVDFNKIVVNRGSLSAGNINGKNNVTINGGKVTATTGLGGDTISIKGGEVTATGGKQGAGIGGGNGESGGTVIISGGTVTATGGYAGAGIGGGNSGAGGTITISGGTVTARGGDLGAGIGGGNSKTGGTITISGGTVSATGGKEGAGIGGGSDGSYGITTLNISGGTVSATGGYQGAGIGGGKWGSCGYITIAGGTVTAIGSDDGAGIGAGNSGGNGTVTISGGTVTATGGKFGAGIGVPLHVDNTDMRIYSGGSGDYAHRTSVDDYAKTRDKFIHMSTQIEEYKVIHQLQKADETGYEEKEQEIIYGVPGTMTKAQGKTYDGFSCEGVTNVGIAEDGSTEVPIKYRRNLYDITFDNNGIGSSTEKITALYGATVTVNPQAPSAAGYEFSGWFEDQLCTKSFSTPQTIEMPFEGKTLYAKWTPIEYTITWKDGSKILKTDKAAYGKTPYYGPDPKKEGYEFVSWWPAIQKVTGNATYNAIFFKPSEKHTIRWMLDDFTYIDSTEVTEGEMPVHENPEREGYIFVGWQPALAPVTGDAKYTAHFVKRGEERVAITFNTDGGSFIDTQVIEKDSIPKKPSDPQKTGYTFEGWYREAGFTTPYNFDEPANADMILYAKWTKTPVKKYEISWFLNDIKLIDTTEVEEGAMPVHENPEIDGYIFIGWQPKLAPATGNRDYIAYFEERGENKVAVTFNTNGGTFIDTQIIDKDSIPVKPTDPEKTGYTFEGWYREARFTTPYNFNEPVNTDMTLYAKWKLFTKSYTITWKDWNGTVLASSIVAENGLPKYPGSSKPSRSGYIFTGWTPEIDLATADTTYTATYEKKSSGGGGGGGGGGGAISTTKTTGATFSPNWYSDIYGVWRIRNSKGEIVKNAWLCDDAVIMNGQNVWYLLGADGAMMAAGLVQDKTGNFYSLETEHNGYFGMLRYKDGYYNCNGQQVYLTFNRQHNGSFGAVTNADGLEKLKAIYGVTQYGIGNENSVYTATF